MPRRARPPALLLAALLSATAAAVAAAAPAAAAPPAPPAAARDTAAARDIAVAGRPVCGPVRLDGVGAVVDEVVERQLAERRIPGAAVAVVAGGRVVHTRGYGVADAGRGTPVDPRRTLFRTGSAGKLFTWTAVLQLVEQGRLDLDADVNGYLDFRIPDTHPGRPVTLRHLMTHTAGFEEESVELFVAGVGDLRPLGAYLADHVPVRVRPPGEVTAYSNFGAALAGYVVQRVSGTPYERYLEERVFAPLGMTRTTARQPLPPALAADLAAGHRWAGGRNRVQPLEVIQGVPAGAHAATVTDMARFMLAQLGAGRYGTGRILAPATARTMQARQFANHPDLPGMTFGFFEETRNGHRMIGHGGDTLNFHTQLTLLPEAGIGLYVAYDGAGEPGTGGQVGARTELVRAVVDRYLPGPAAGGSAARDSAAAGTAGRNAAGDAARFAGRYTTTRANVSTVERLAGIGGTTVIEARPDGTLRAPGESGNAATWRPVGPLLFREDGTQQLLGFRQDASGAVTYAFSGDDPSSAARRIPWWQDSTVHLIGGASGLAVLLLTLLLWPAGALVARWRRRRSGRPPLPPGARRTRRLAWAVAALTAAQVTGFGFMAADFEHAVLFGLSPLTRAVQAAGAVLVVAAVLLAVAAAAAWVRRWWRVPGRLGVTLVALGALAYAAFAGYYHLAEVPLG